MTPKCSMVATEITVDELDRSWVVDSNKTSPAYRTNRPRSCQCRRGLTRCRWWMEPFNRRPACWGRSTLPSMTGRPMIRSIRALSRTKGFSRSPCSKRDPLLPVDPTILHVSQTTAPKNQTNHQAAKHLGIAFEDIWHLLGEGTCATYKVRGQCRSGGPPPRSTLGQAC